MSQPTAGSSSCNGDGELDYRTPETSGSHFVHSIIQDGIVPVNPELPKTLNASKSSKRILSFPSSSSEEDEEDTFLSVVVGGVGRENAGQAEIGWNDFGSLGLGMEEQQQRSNPIRDLTNSTHPKDLTNNSFHSIQEEDEWYISFVRRETGTLKRNLQRSATAVNKSSRARETSPDIVDGFNPIITPRIRTHNNNNVSSSGFKERTITKCWKPPTSLDPLTSTRRPIESNPGAVPVPEHDNETLLLGDNNMESEGNNNDDNMDDGKEEHLHSSTTRPPHQFQPTRVASCGNKRGKLCCLFKYPPKGKDGKDNAASSSSIPNPSRMGPTVTKCKKFTMPGDRQARFVYERQFEPTFLKYVEKHNISMEHFGPRPYVCNAHYGYIRKQIVGFRRRQTSPTPLSVVVSSSKPPKSPENHYNDNSSSHSGILESFPNPQLQDTIKPETNNPPTNVVAPQDNLEPPGEQQLILKRRGRCSTHELNFLAGYDTMSVQDVGFLLSKMITKSGRGNLKYVPNPLVFESSIGQQTNNVPQRFVLKDTLLFLVEVNSHAVLGMAKWAISGDQPEILANFFTFGTYSSNQKVCMFQNLTQIVNSFLLTEEQGKPKIRCEIIDEYHGRPLENCSKDTVKEWIDERHILAHSNSCACVMEASFLGYQFISGQWDGLPSDLFQGDHVANNRILFHFCRAMMYSFLCSSSPSPSPPSSLLASSKELTKRTDRHDWITWKPSEEYIQMHRQLDNYYRHQLTELAMSEAVTTLAPILKIDTTNILDDALQLKAKEYSTRFQNRNEYSDISDIELVLAAIAHNLAKSSRFFDKNHLHPIVAAVESFPDNTIPVSVPPPQQLPELCPIKNGVEFWPIIYKGRLSVVIKHLKIRVQTPKVSEQQQQKGGPLTLDNTKHGDLLLFTIITSIRTQNDCRSILRYFRQKVNSPLKCSFKIQLLPPDMMEKLSFHQSSLVILESTYQFTLTLVTVQSQQQQQQQSTKAVMFRSELMTMVANIQDPYYLEFIRTMLISLLLSSCTNNFKPVVVSQEDGSCSYCTCTINQATNSGVSSSESSNKNAPLSVIIPGPSRPRNRKPKSIGKLLIGFPIATIPDAVRKKLDRTDENYVANISNEEAKCLGKNQWLTDSVVEEYLELIGRFSDELHQQERFAYIIGISIYRVLEGAKFSDKIVKDMMIPENLLDFSYVVFPLHIRDSHWVVYTVHPGKMTGVFYSSLPGYYRYVKKQLEEIHGFFERMMLNKLGSVAKYKSIIDPLATVQAEGDESSCGLHIISYVCSLLLGIRLRTPHNEGIIDRYRIHILTELLERKILPNVDIFCTGVVHELTNNGYMFSIPPASVTTTIPPLPLPLGIKDTLIITNNHKHLSLHSPIVIEGKRMPPITFDFSENTSDATGVNNTLVIERLIGFAASKWPQFKSVLSDVQEQSSVISWVETLVAAFNNMVAIEAGTVHQSCSHEIHSSSSSWESELNVLLDIAETGAIDDHNRLRDPRAFSETTYGSVSTELIAGVISEGQIGQDDEFLDLGSGLGNVVLRVAAYTKCRKATGIEIRPCLARYAKKNAQLFHDLMTWSGFSAPTNYALSEGDFLDSLPQLLQDTTVIFMNNNSFSAETNLRIGDCVLKICSNGRRIITEKPLGLDSSRGITTRNVHDVGSILESTTPPALSGMVTWTKTPVQFTLQVVNRDGRDKFLLCEHTSKAKHSKTSSSNPTTSNLFVTINKTEEITNEQAQKLKHASEIANKQPICDVHALYLSDAILNGYLWLLEDFYNTNHWESNIFVINSICFMIYKTQKNRRNVYTNKKKNQFLNTAAMILIPINREGNHWVLGVAFRSKVGKWIQIYNSLYQPKEDEEAEMDIYNMLTRTDREYDRNPENNVPWERLGANPALIPKQTIGYQCGSFVMEFARRLVLFLPNTFFETISDKAATLETTTASLQFDSEDMNKYCLRMYEELKSETLQDAHFQPKQYYT